MPKTFSRNRPEHDRRHLGGSRIDESAFRHIGTQDLEKVGVGRQDVDTTGFQLRDEVVAPHAGIGGWLR